MPDMTENPYQDTIDWLESPEGERWSMNRYRKSTWAKNMFSVKDDTAECSQCQAGYDHEKSKFIVAAGDLGQDGPHADFAAMWCRGVIKDLWAVDHVADSLAYAITP